MRSKILALTAVFMLIASLASADVFTVAVGNRWRDLKDWKMQQEKELVFIGRLAFPEKACVKLIVEAERPATQEPNLKCFVGVGISF